MTTADTDTATWAHVEAMGHRSHHGRISEEQIAGKTFLRVDSLRIVAGADGEPDQDVWTTSLYNPDSIYCLRPPTEAQVREAVAPWRPGRPELTEQYPTDDDGDDDDGDDEFR